MEFLLLALSVGVLTVLGLIVDALNGGPGTRKAAAELAELEVTFDDVKNAPIIDAQRIGELIRARARVSV